MCQRLPHIRRERTAPSTYAKALDKGRCPLILPCIKVWFLISQRDLFPSPPVGIAVSDIQVVFCLASLCAVKCLVSLLDSWLDWDFDVWQETKGPCPSRLFISYTRTFERGVSEYHLPSSDRRLRSIVRTVRADQRCWLSHFLAAVPSWRAKLDPAYTCRIATDARYFRLSFHVLSLPLLPPPQIHHRLPSLQTRRAVM